MEEKLSTIQRHFEMKFRESQGALMVQEKTIEILIDVMKQIVP
jgi:hypothetical protein